MRGQGTIKPSTSRTEETLGFAPVVGMWCLGNTSVGDVRRLLRMNVELTEEIIEGLFLGQQIVTNYWHVRRVMDFAELIEAPPSNVSVLESGTFFFSWDGPEIRLSICMTIEGS